MFGRGSAPQALFDQAKPLDAAGKTFIDIVAEIGVKRRTVAKSVKTDILPHRRRYATNPEHDRENMQRASGRNVIHRRSPDFSETKSTGRSTLFGLSARCGHEKKGRRACGSYEDHRRNTL